MLGVANLPKESHTGSLDGSIGVFFRVCAGVGGWEGAGTYLRNIADKAFS